MSDLFLWIYRTLPPRTLAGRWRIWEYVRYASCTKYGTSCRCGYSESTTWNESPSIFQEQHLSGGRRLTKTLRNEPKSANPVRRIRSLFSRYGIPDQIVTDNGPQFTAEEFNKFCLGNGIKHTLTAPYHPNTNGEAERFVQTFKTSILKHKGALQKNLCNFLLHYWSTPHTYYDWKNSSWDHVWSKHQDQNRSLASTLKRKTLSTRQVKEWSILWEKCSWTRGWRCSLDAKLLKVTNLDSRFHHHKVWPTELPSPCKWKIPQKTYWPTTNSFFGYFGR